LILSNNSFIMFKSDNADKFRPKIVNKKKKNAKDC
jgi:hypothetical protein